MNQFVFVPVGGLANRMRAVASAAALVRKAGMEADIVWFQDWALHAPFHALFCPIDRRDIRLREATLADHVLYDRPRRRNLYVPRLFQQMLFRTRIYEKSVTPLYAQGFDFERPVRQGTTYMASYCSFADYPPELLRRLFEPLPPLRARIDRLCSRFSAHTIGVHIRRTDNVESIRQSPTELFCKAIDEEIGLHPETSVFLATDDNTVKQELRARYGERVICVPEAAGRGSTDDIGGGYGYVYARQNAKDSGFFPQFFLRAGGTIGRRAVDGYKETEHNELQTMKQLKKQ